MSGSSAHEEELFAAALALPAAERAAYLECECRGDVELRRRVEALLRVHETIGGFLEKPAEVGLPDFARSATVKMSEQTLGTMIGRYKLLQKIGEGGCGVVYMAEQETPVQRKVALKIIRLGMDTKEVIARFEAERQALALMDHPNIARVFDAGATDTGRPYFVMELVRGVKITAYCDQHNLATTERLHLFTQVCHAIQHAHEKGIIHRDIKPSNILVTLQDGAPVPKVIDFGIAKATQGRLTDQTLFTAFEQFIGTPAYMSPEQAELSSQDVDPRSDIYSLGVLLYELLTGQTPFDAKSLLQAGLDEIRRVIREVEPPKPSTRLSTLEGEALANTALHRATESPKLIHLIRGDLDWIVMRCLEKNRTRRYETAAALAEDLGRHLAHRPIIARRPGPVYRARKFVRRNRPFLVTGGAALLVGLGVGAWFYLRERHLLPPPTKSPSAVTEATAAGAEEKVGLFGEPESIVFTGNRSFSARAIREGLAGHTAFFLAAHPDAPLGEFVETVRKAVLRGYQGLGFPDVAVTVQTNHALRRLEVTVAEGQRFVCGEVRVQETERIPAADIVRAVSSPAYGMPDALTVAVEFVLAGQQGLLTPPSSAGGDSKGTSVSTTPSLFTTPLIGPDTGWVDGTPVSFTPDNLDAIRGAVRRLVDARGFPLAEVEAKINPDRTTNRADLQLTIREGPEVVIGSVIVHGNSRNRPEEIARCAGLAAGMRLDSGLLARAKVALWNSARFYAFGIQVRPAMPDSRACDVEITVQESEVMPPLRAALPRQQAALVRFANWMTADAARRELDLVISDPTLPEIGVALTPEALAIYTEGAPDGSLLAFLGRPNGVRLFAGSATENAGFDLLRWKGRGDVFCRLVTTPAAANSERHASFELGYGVVRGPGADYENPAPIVVAPIIACQYLATKAAPSYANGEVAFDQSVGGIEMRIRFREATGELIEWTAVPTVDPNAAKGDFNPRVSVRVGGTEMARISGRIDQVWAKLPYDPAQRRSLADGILHSSLAEHFSATPATGRFLRRAATAIRIAERLAAAPGTRSRLDLETMPDTPDFPIPPDPQLSRPRDDISLGLSHMAYQASRVIGPPTTWPARIGRELSYAIFGAFGHTDVVLDDLDRDSEMGPLGSMLTAKLLRLIHSPYAWRFARRALERSSLGDFRADYDMLLAGDSAVARLVRQTLPAVAAMSDQELDAVTGGLSSGEDLLLRTAVTTLRGVKAEGVAAVLRPVFESWWDHEMRPDLAVRICAILGCGEAADPAMAAAVVNGEPLSRKTLALGCRHPDWIASLPSPLSAPLFAASQPPSNDPTLDALATLMLAEQEAVRQGADSSDAATDRGIDGLVQEQYRGDRSAFEAMLAREGVTLADFRPLWRLNDGFRFLQERLDREAAAQNQHPTLQDQLNRLRASAFVYVVPMPSTAQTK